MKQQKKQALAFFYAFLLVATVLFAFLGCGKAGAGQKPAKTTLLLAAAASLEDIFANSLIPFFEAQNPDIKISASYGGSGALKTQIEEGLLADIFIPASNTAMQELTESGFVNSQDIVPLLQNQLVLIAPINTELNIAGFNDIVKATSIALADVDSVPAGQYAKEALQSLGLYRMVEKKASYGSSVTQVLQWVANGSAQLGIVYKTDAMQMPNAVKIVAHAPKGSLAAPPTYPIGVLANSQNKTAANTFLQFLQSPQASQIFADAGFLPLPKPQT